MLKTKIYTGTCGVTWEPQLRLLTCNCNYKVKPMTHQKVSCESHLRK